MAAGWLGVPCPARHSRPARRHRLESELAAMAPAGVSIHATRVPLGVMRTGGLMDPTIALEPVRAFADPPLVDDAAELLAAAPLHAIGFAFTSSSYVRGAADDEILRRRLEARTHGIPVAISSVSAVLGAARTLGARRIALVDPPWFSPELTALGVNYFTGQGFEVAYAAAAGYPASNGRSTPDSSSSGSTSTCRPRPTRSTSAATACARPVSSRRWRKIWTSPCSRPTRSSSGISYGWPARTRPSLATAGCSIVTCPPRSEQTAG